MTEFNHISVLYNEVIEGLNIKKDGIYVDGTLGGAGHASGVCERLSKEGTLIGIDQDGYAIKTAKERLEKYECNVNVVRDNFANMKQVVKGLDISGVDGITLDLGVSSYQLDTVERGFSYRFDAPLDMRMDDRNPLTAYMIVNSYSKGEISHILKAYGEEKFADNIAKHIVMEREKSPIETTGELAKIIDMSIPMKFKKMGGHPAKRTFQALRIMVNSELSVLEDNIADMVDLLNPGGRLCVISFHSLEDRIVKKAFAKLENPCTCPKDFPVCVCGNKPKGKRVNRKPILPTEEEMERNPRAKSAKLRIFERNENK
ncbi:MAG: 16S rRNA (cytosine(1402)-N(4))-methyltransferase RsmH [Lachnospiraceae bacterium]|nr:16S rRNA (cytosine(1402)-N(4))-methyltransferase RsmH [Lachnospiraceae bacterium]